MYGDQLNWFQRFMQRFYASPATVVAAELKDAELAALACEAKAEYAALRIEIYKLTTKYHQNRIIRLRKFLMMNQEPTAYEVRALNSSEEDIDKLVEALKV